MNKTEQTVLVTGASSGIGKAIATEYALRGYHLVVVARRSERLEALKIELESRYGIRVYCIACDLRNEYAPEIIEKALLDAGIEIEILFNNAGMGTAGIVADDSWEKLSGIIDLNVKATTHMCWRFLRTMAARGNGTIVNIASTLSFAPAAGQCVYAASKAYVLSLSQGLYEETRGTGVKVLTICPGLTATGFFDAAGFSQDQFKAASPEALARFIYKKVSQGKALSIHGLFNRCAALFARIFPRGLVRRVFSIVSRPTLKQ